MAGRFGSAGWRRAGFFILALGMATLLAGCAGKKEQPAPSGGGTPAGTASQPADEWGEIVIGPNDPVRVGVAVTLSGSVAALGVPIRDAAALAIEEKGQVLGHKVEVDAQDDGCQPEPSVNVARRFTSDKLMVGVIGSMCSSGTIPASDVYDKAHMVMISPSSTAPNVTSRGLKNVFRTCWNDEIQGAGQARFALDELGAKKAVLVHDKSPYGQGLMEAFRKTFEAGGGRVAAFEAIDVGQTDFSALVTKIKQLGPDVVSFGGFIKEGAFLVRQLREAGVKAAFMGADGIDADEFVQNAGPAAEGVYISNGQALQGMAYQEFARKYKEKYGKEPGVFTAQAYDAANILLAAVEKVARNEPDGSLRIGKKALRDAVAATSVEGATGSVKFKDNGDREQAGEVVIKQVRDGKRDNLVATIPPQ